MLGEVLGSTTVGMHCTNSDCGSWTIVIEEVDVLVRMAYQCDCQDDASQARARARQATLALALTTHDCVACHKQAGVVMSYPLKVCCYRTQWCSLVQSEITLIPLEQVQETVLSGLPCARQAWLTPLHTWSVWLAITSGQHAAQCGYPY